MNVAALDRASLDRVLVTDPGGAAPPRPRPTRPARGDPRVPELAPQAPTGFNRQNWRWLVVTDPDTRRAIVDIYRHSGAALPRTIAAMWTDFTRV